MPWALPGMSPGTSQVCAGSAGNDWVSYDPLDSGIPHGLIEPPTVGGELIDREGKKAMART